MIRGVSSSTTAFAGRITGSTAVATPPIAAWMAWRREMSTENPEDDARIQRRRNAFCRKAILVDVYVSGLYNIGEWQRLNDEDMRCCSAGEVSINQLLTTTDNNNNSRAKLRFYRSLGVRVMERNTYVRARR
jgi:hypothetical protein